MQTIAEMFEHNAKLFQEVFDLNRLAMQAGLEVAQKAVVGSTELAVAFAKDLQDATSPTAAVEAAVKASSKATKLAAERASEMVANGQKYARDAQQVAARVTQA